MGDYDQISYNGSCGYVKTPEMAGRVSIFASGKMISIGSKTIEDSINNLNQTKFYLLKENLIKEIMIKPIIRNIVAITNFGISLDLKLLETKIPGCVYDPDVFAGLRFKIEDISTVLIFASGKMIIVGSKSIHDLNRAYKIIKK